MSELAPSPDYALLNKHITLVCIASPHIPIHLQIIGCMPTAKKKRKTHPSYPTIVGAGPPSQSDYSCEPDRLGVMIKSEISKN